ncbi:MAG TPA: flap endonuclease-1 [Vicinamibacterales bacterium]|nr:flap endonuclease-1 [Vicinamibacterales bacterium]
MGVNLTPIIVKQPLALEDLRGRRVAIDGHGELYQFLALIRLPDGTPLRDRQGRVTSHLSGLFYRTTRLIADHGLQMVFVFDGVPPLLKTAEIEKRRAVKARYEAEADTARSEGDLAAAYSKSTMTSRLSRDMVAEARELLRLMGIPSIQAPGEGEAQAAHMAAAGSVWAAVSKDYDTLLFGAPRLVRFLTVSGREFLPGAGTFRKITPELIDRDAWLESLGITGEQAIDLALLVGTDFNAGIKGIGPKKALQLVRKHGRIEEMPPAVREEVLAAAEAIRDIYLRPEVTSDYTMDPGPCDRAAVVRFLCDEHAFAQDRVEAALARAFG